MGNPCFVYSVYIVLMVLLALNASPKAVAEENKTWVEINKTIYGAKPDKVGPIGGGKGYKKIITKGDHTVSSLDQLLSVLKKAKKDQVIYIDGKLQIDCTTRVYIEKLVLEIPAGVTLASNRGYRGSKGALIFSETFATRPLIRIMGPDVRITGLRIRGPNPNRHIEHHKRSFAQKKGRDYYYKFPVSDGIETFHPDLEVDNCEISAWSHAGINLKKGDKHHIHHNYIHHNQYNGLGYGVCHDTAFSMIEYNLFNYNRHSIAGTGRKGSGYEACNNIELGVSLSHCFDMHGGRDRKDRTNIAGTWIKFHHNTFYAPNPAIKIRGKPIEGADIYNNLFYQTKKGKAVYSLGNTKIHNNAYGIKKPKVQ